MSRGDVSTPPAGKAARGRPSRPALPPRWLEPVLILAEAIDRRRRHIRPIRKNGVLGLELLRYGGRPIRLQDGCQVERGSPVGAIHFLNDRVREIGAMGWQLAGYREGRLDMALLADWASRQGAAGDPECPVAFLGTTILFPLFAREGWQPRLVPRTWRTRLDAWWMHWMMAHFSRSGRERVRHGHGRLEVTELWLSRDALVRRYGRQEAATRNA